jgi:hypothetical protein
MNPSISRFPVLPCGRQQGLPDGDGKARRVSSCRRQAGGPNQSQLAVLGCPQWTDAPNAQIRRPVHHCAGFGFGLGLTGDPHTVHSSRFGMASNQRPHPVQRGWKSRVPSMPCVLTVCVLSPSRLATSKSV